MMLSDFFTLFEKRGSKAALYHKKERGSSSLSYGEITALTNALSAYFARTGLKKGDRVMLWGSNSPEWVLGLLACLRQGIIAVPMDIRGSARFVQKIYTFTKASLILCDSDKASGLDGMKTLGFDELKAVAENFPPRFQAERPAPSDTAALFFTSGTTAEPKGAILTHENIFTEVEILHRAVKGFKPHEKFLSLLPLSHIFEQVIGLWFPLRRGYSVTYLQHLQASAIFRALAEDKITFIPVVPRLLKMMKSGIEREVRNQGKEKAFSGLLRAAGYFPAKARRFLFPALRKKFGNLRYFLVGGATLNPGLERFWDRAGIALLQGYGLTETSSVVSCNIPGARRLRSIGRIIPGVEVKLNSEGEIWVKGKTVFRGYYENPEKTREAFEDGWYKTGDLGEFDGDGFLYFKGRKKDLIVTGEGLNVYPDDIEAVLEHIPGVKESCVFAVTKEKGEIVHACLLLEDPGTDIRSIIEAANRELESYQAIKEASVWPDEDFPRTPTAKVIKRRVAERVLSEQKTVRASSGPKMAA